jgi:RNA polymerase sigma-70 factor, ECF subfamily
VEATRPDPDGDKPRRRAADFLAICSSDRSFRPWYEAALPRVFGYICGRIAGDKELAEEITQQAFIAAVRSRAEFDGQADPVAWVCSIARNALVDHYRRLARESRRHLSLVVREIAVDGDARAWTRLDQRDEVLAALRALTADQRAAVLLHYVDGLSVREIAMNLKRSESSVESLLARGRERLRALLGDQR